VPIYQLTDELAFPHPSLAAPSGLLAVGGDLRPERLILAYRHGIFPWYSEGRPILWWCPSPRLVLRPTDLHVGRSLQKAIRRGTYRITCDRAFLDVMTRCAEASRPQQEGTWITDDMIEAFAALHEMGLAHSVEAWTGEAGAETLVGGVYGLSLGATFFGESMFAAAPDASKVAFVHLARQLARWSFDLIDCQVVTDHLVRFGATEIELEDFLLTLAASMDRPTREGPWRFDDDFDPLIAADDGSAGRQPT
jgi:leucyl/phenylalanyl-tRNA--protein transferase